MRSILKDYLRLTRREVNGTLVLVIILCAQLLVHAYAGKLIPDPPFPDPDQTRMILTHLSDSRRGEGNTVLKLVPFCPDTMDYDDFIDMGIPAKIASGWSGYQKKGGKIRSDSDLKKIWGMNDSLFEHLSMYIRYAPDQRVKHQVVSQNWKEKSSEVIELNSADSASLDKLPGIGPAFARRIIRYRERLGGYYATGQLMEIYGMTSELYSKILPYVRVDTSLICPIFIMEATWASLIRHPYMTRESVSHIMELKKAGKELTSIKQLIESNIISPEQAIKLSPYLVFVYP